jgi:hypothetical protein
VTKVKRFSESSFTDKSEEEFKLIKGKTSNLLPKVTKGSLDNYNGKDLSSVKAKNSRSSSKVSIRQIVNSDEPDEETLEDKRRKKKISKILE